MNARMKRHIASWGLLAVFVPMLILSSLHTHNPSTDFAGECNECVQHHCHGHLTQDGDGIHDCVLCQFLALSFVAAATIVVALCSKFLTLYTLRKSDIRPGVSGIPPMRGPPTLMRNA